MYTILAYKPDSSDYCMGCHVASYSSGFEYYYTEDRGEAVKFIAGKLVNNKHMDNNEDGYEITILMNGAEPSQDTWDELHEGKEWSDHCHAEAMMEEAKALAEKEIADAKKREEEAKAQREEAAKVQAAIDKENKERATYERLKAKYEEKSV